jgi:hypothetical protein
VEFVKRAFYARLVRAQSRPRIPLP